MVVVVLASWQWFPAAFAEVHFGVTCVWPPCCWRWRSSAPAQRPHARAPVCGLATVRPRKDEDDQDDDE